MDLGGWLRSLGLERYEAAFRENEISERVLPSLTAEDLKELGVSALGHRRILLDAAPCRSRPRVEQLWPREDPLVDLVVAECRLVFFETQAPQPDHNVHDGAYNQRWRASSAG